MAYGVAKLNQLLSSILNAEGRSQQGCVSLAELIFLSLIVLPGSVCHMFTYFWPDHEPRRSTVKPVLVLETGYRPWKSAQVGPLKTHLSPTINIMLTEDC